jgi:hypothetical protein
MTRAVARTLRAAWNADIRLANAPTRQARIRDLALLEDRVRGFLSGGGRLPIALRDEARARMQWASVPLGPVSITGVHFIERVWRSLILDLCALAPVISAQSHLMDANWMTRGSLQRFCRSALSHSGNA